MPHNFSRGDNYLDTRRHEEHVTDIMMFDLSRLIVTPGNALETIAPFKRNDFGVR
jgi:hypothetical protein